jgi:hypothetical protein
MTGARFVHDALAWWGWDLAIADAARVKGLAPLAAKTDQIDARVLAELRPIPSLKPTSDPSSLALTSSRHRGLRRVAPAAADVLVRLRRR